MKRTMYLIMALILTSVSCLTAAAELHYADVPLGAWYVEEVQNFIDQGYLDKSQQFFRPSDSATRAEFMKLVVELNGGILDEIPATPSFNDISPGDWFFGYLEESAREGWVKGDGNCFGSKPCSVRPNSPITRAEASILIRRAFGKKRIGRAPAFADNPAGEWFTDAIQGAADHCILRGDEGTRNVRPHDLLNRAEMVAMLYRVDNGGRYPDCL